MRFRTLVMLLCGVVLSLPAEAQDQAVRQAPPARQEGPLPAPTRNVRFEIAVTESGVPRPTTRRANLLVAVGREGQLRSKATESTGQGTFTRDVPFNVDITRPLITETGEVLVMLSIEYQPSSPGTVTFPSVVRARLEALLPSGQKTLVTQAADPTSDRVTTLEVTATVVK